MCERCSRFAPLSRSASRPTARLPFSVTLRVEHDQVGLAGGTPDMSGLEAAPPRRHAVLGELLR